MIYLFIYLNLIKKITQRILSLEKAKIQFLPTDRPVYACLDCHQPYWWSNKESSSPARAMKMADKLHKTVLKHLRNNTNKKHLSHNHHSKQKKNKHGKKLHMDVINDNNDDENEAQSEEIESKETVYESETIQYSNTLVTSTSSSSLLTISNDLPTQVIDYEELNNIDLNDDTTSSKSLTEMFEKRNKYLTSSILSDDSGNTHTPVNIELKNDSNSIENHSDNKSNANVNENVEHCKLNKILQFQSAYVVKNGYEALITNWCNDFQG